MIVKCAMLLGMGSMLLGEPSTPGTPGGDKAGKPEPAAVTPAFYEFEVEDVDGKKVQLSKYKGDVCLVVNVASQCGLTPQYAGLETLHKKYKERGLHILAFPANNFREQEPGTNAEIKKFCSEKFGVTFDLFAKVSVMGDDQCPLYRFLTHHPDEKIAGDVLWNFQKYLVARDGTVIAKFDPRTEPGDEKLIAGIEAALGTKGKEAGDPGAAGTGSGEEADEGTNRDRG